MSVEVPQLGGNEVLLNAACTSQRDCIVVGRMGLQPLLFEWNGANFERMATAQVTGSSTLAAVAVVNGLAVAVGYRDTPAPESLVEMRR
jgi:hypothetical protein